MPFRVKQNTTSGSVDGCNNSSAIYSTHNVGNMRHMTTTHTYCVCVPSRLFLTSISSSLGMFWDAPARVTQEEGHTGMFSPHLHLRCSREVLSRDEVQPFLSFVGLLCTCDESLSNIQHVLGHNLGNFSLWATAPRFKITSYIQISRFRG